MMPKQVLIIGGTKGIGFSVAKRLARKHQVAVVGRGKPAYLEKNIEYFPSDLLDLEEVKRTLELIIKAKSQVNYLLFFQRHRGTQEAWEGEIQVSLTATKQVIESLADRFDLKEASIVLTSSVNASFISGHLPIGYHIAKAGLVQMARYYAIKLGPQGIRVNSLSLGTILKEETKKYLLQNENLVKFYDHQAPLRRMGTVNDVANVVEFLCSPKSSFITGQDIVLNGGVSIQWQEALALNSAP